MAELQPLGIYSPKSPRSPAPSTSSFSFETEVQASGRVHPRSNLNLDSNSSPEVSLDPDSNLDSGRKANIGTDSLNFDCSTMDSLGTFEKDAAGITSDRSSSVVAPNESVKVICVGMMRTGLRTVHRLLETLGYQNIYDQEDLIDSYQQWDRVLREGDESGLREMFQGREVIMGMPTFCFWEQIVNMYPNAKVILTVRDEEDWWQSIRHAWQLMQTDLPGAPLNHGSRMRSFEQMLVPSYHKYCEALRFAWKSTLGVDALGDTSGLNEVMARNSFKRHDAYVQAMLGGQTLSDGSARLLVYNVASDGWAPLCDFLAMPVPTSDFPSEPLPSAIPGGEPDEPNTAYEERLLPDLASDFADQVRHELRKSLLLGGVCLAVVLSPVAAVVLHSQLVSLPPSAVLLGSISALALGWNIHVVLQGLVFRVPALFILPTALKGLFIAGALQACFISYGILKEMLVTQDKIASPVLVLSSRLGAIVCAVAFLFLTEGKVTLGAPITSMAAFAITNEASTWAGYEMLKYVAFPVQVMAKSVKMLPSMLMGRVVNGTQYTWTQYAQAVLALICVAIMNFSDSGNGSGKPKAKAAASEDMSATYKLGMGVLMLGLFFVCDSFTSQWQAVLYKKHPKLTQTQMMLGGNLLGFFVTAATAVASWSKVQSSMALAIADPAIAGRIACLGVVYALGQFCIYSAIRILGPLTFTWIMTARQLLSVLISLVIFGHGINFVKVTCILMVFGIMSAKQLSQATRGLREALKTRARAAFANVGIVTKEAVEGEAENKFDSRRLTTMPTASSSSDTAGVKAASTPKSSTSGLPTLLHVPTGDTQAKKVQ